MAKTREEELIEFVKNDIELGRWENAKRNLMLIARIKDTKTANKEIAVNAKRALDAGKIEIAVEFIRTLK